MSEDTYLAASEDGEEGAGDLFCCVGHFGWFVFGG